MNKDKYCIINLKTYEEAFNINLLPFIEEIESCSDLAENLGVELIICVNSYDLKDAIKFSNKVTVFGQHCDSFSFGSHTGSTPTSVLVRLGALGTLISHSERYLGVDEVVKDFQFAKDFHLQTCICVRDIQRLTDLQSKGVSGLFALEPPELIGGDISVTSANPEIISQAYDNLNKNSVLLVGAGIKNRQDVKKALELGAKGVLVASGIVKSPNVKKSLMDLLEGFRE